MAPSMTTITVVGMTCEHCVKAVSQELSKVAGVTGVDVDLASGRVNVEASAPIDTADLRAAVDEAGYELAP